MEKEALNKIIEEINSENLTPGECREIANALKKQRSVIGSAIYTMDDAEDYVKVVVANRMVQGKRGEEVYRKSLEKFVSGFDDVLQDFLINGEEELFCNFAWEIVEKETPELQEDQEEPSVETFEF